MRIIRAEHLGMCFGVRDAIALAFETAKNEPLTILGELVHNDTVLEELRAGGIRIEPKSNAATTKNVMITAHGASQVALDRTRQAGHRVIEATCPLVHFAHRALGALVAQGYYPVIIGRRDHVEVRGMTEDLTECSVIETSADIELLPIEPRYGVVAQTTQPIDKVHWIVAQIRERFRNAEVRFSDTVCQPTKQRQSSAIALAKQCDVVIVIGGLNSNNTRELVATCSKFCQRVHHVQSVADLRCEWFENANVTGITAGTSTPEVTIHAVENWLHEFAMATTGV